VLTAAALVAAIVASRLSFLRGLQGKLDPRLTVFQLVFLAVTVARDLLYFQWMKLRRSRYPLAMAVLFLAVFVTCSVVVINTLGWIGEGKRAFFAAVPLPWIVLFLEQGSWAGIQAGWIMVLGTQVALCVLFAWLHSRRLAEMLPSRRAERSASASIATSGI
jgi:heme/copper-type cytochrome/quinol oxidase subunit 4